MSKNSSASDQFQQAGQKRRYFLTGMIGFFLGIMVCLIWQLVYSFLPNVPHLPVTGFHWITQNKVNPNFQNLNPNDDPIEQMNRMRRQMLQQAFRNFPQDQLNLDAENEEDLELPAQTDGIGSVKQRQDEHFIYLDISIKGLDRQSLSVEVKDGQVNLRGQVHRQNDLGANAKSEMIESFNKSFPAPANVDPKKVEIENSTDLLTLKFPKL